MTSLTFIIALPPNPYSSPFGVAYSHFFHLKIQYGTTAAATISTSA
jgi:hypothetical protein